MITKTLSFLGAIAILGVILAGSHYLTTAYPNEIGEAISELLEYARGLNWLIPVDTAITILGLIFLLEFAIFSITSIIWVYNKITHLTS